MQVQINVELVYSCAIVETKKTLKIVVKTTVVYPELAKSKLTHAKSSTGFT